jgi:hypothetical protein
MSYWHTISKLGNRNEVRRSGRKSYPSRVLFIGTSKRLKDSNTPTV